MYVIIIINLIINEMNSNSEDENYIGTLEDIKNSNLLFTGTQINYFFVCKRKMWLVSHNINLESSSELVYLGKLLHENSYRRERLSELEFGRIKLDYIKKSNEIHEIKRSRKIEKAHIFQLVYYLYFLKEFANIKNLKGVIDYPLLKKRKTVLLEEHENELKSVLQEIKEIIGGEKPPEPEWKPICRKCAYLELCWS